MAKLFNISRTLFHLLITVCHIITISHTITLYATGAIPEQMRGSGLHFFTLTNITLHIHIVTFALTLISDFFKSDSYRWPIPNIFRLRNLLFNRLALPMGFFVSVGFWSVAFLNRDLLSSQVIQKILPTWKNHVIHTMPLVITLIDTILTDHKRRAERDRSGLLLLATVMTLYCSNVLYLGYMRGHWIYPFLKGTDGQPLYNTLLRVGFVFTNFLFTSIYYYIGGILYDLAWYNKPGISKLIRKFYQQTTWKGVE